MNCWKTIGRLLKYIGKYKFRLVGVFFLMLLTTVTSLCGSYMLAPIINRISYEVTGKMPEYSMTEKIADDLLLKIIGFENPGIETYVFTAVCVLAVIYIVSILSSYLQARFMLTDTLRAR